MKPPQLFKPEDFNPHVGFLYAPVSAEVAQAIFEKWWEENIQKAPGLRMDVCGFVREANHKTHLRILSLENLKDGA